jgi:hypothetical protein
MYLFFSVLFVSFFFVFDRKIKFIDETLIQLTFLFSLILQVIITYTIQMQNTSQRLLDILSFDQIVYFFHDLNTKTLKIVLGNRCDKSII